MDVFGSLKLQRHVYTTAGLTSMVRCTESLPDPNGPHTFLNTVYHLTASQPGYVANHVYVCALKDGAKYWRDLTESSTVSQDTSGLSAGGYMASFNGEMFILVLHWGSPADTTTKIWTRDIIVRKLDSYPASIEDGEILTVCETRNLYNSTVTPYQSGPVSPDPSGHAFYYRVFHVFESNEMTYNNIVLADPLT